MQYNKIDPLLETTLSSYSQEGIRGVIRYKNSLGIVATENVPKTPRIVVFIEFNKDPTSNTLSDYGVRINGGKSRLRTAIIPIESIEKVSEDPIVKRIISSQYVNLSMDKASVRVRYPQFINSTHLSGEGVVIGVIDSGIDPNHQAFSGRLLRIWDQTLNGPGVPEGGYGLELSGQLITASRDVNGHGTHVAGIAAGEDQHFPGVARKSTLVIVKTSMQNAHIADGIRYTFRIAQDLNRPAVINLSLGGHFDAHDGTDGLSETINDESGPGRIVCCAAGNEGNDNIHARTSLSQGQVERIRFTIPASPSPNLPDDIIRNVILNGWYPGTDRIEVAIVSPSGTSTGFQPIIENNSFSRVYDLPEGKVNILTPPNSVVNNDHNFLVVISHQSGFALPVEPGLWRLLLNGTNINSSHSIFVDVWSLNDSEYQTQTIDFGSSIDDSRKIGSPGCAERSITVGSYTTKITWTDVDGTSRNIGLDLEDISDFSSEGPLRNEMLKPDLAAPGAMIASAMSSDAETPLRNRVDQLNTIKAGTSMATPLISGIVALLLQRDPSLDPERIKDTLRNNSFIPGRQSNTFDKKWGFGLLDMTGLTNT